MVIAVALIGALGMLIFGASASYILFVTKWEFGWLYFGGVLVLGLVTVWALLRTLKKYTIRLITEVQKGSEESIPTEVDSKPIDYQELNEFGNHDRVLITSDGKSHPMVDTLTTSGFKVDETVDQARGDREALYHQFVEFWPDGVLIHCQGEILYANESGVKILGATGPNQLVGRLILDFVHSDHQEIMARRIRQLNKPVKTAAPTELKYVRLDGQIVEVDLVETPLIYQDKLAVQVVFRDISERKKTEAEITQRNRELTILVSAGAAITSRLDLRYVLDTVAQEMTRLLDVENCIISEWSQQTHTISQMAKYSPQGWWDPKTKPQVYHLADYPVTRAVLEDQIPEQMTINQPNIDPSELAYMKQANIKTVLMLPIIFQRRVLGLVRLEDSRVERVFTYHEISIAKLLAGQAGSAIENAQLFEQAQQEIKERIRAEAALEEERSLLAERVKERTTELSIANAELARASRLKDEFLAGMSHELRTPLNAILGSTEILQTEVFGEINEKQLRYANNIEESGQHLLTLINDILDLSKVEAGKLEMEFGPVLIQSVCEASLRLVKQLAHQKQINISSSYNQTITTLYADERRLKQILVNLLSNAIKFTPEEGQIGLEVTENLETQAVHFMVWDTGIGISQEDMVRLFQPFVQLDSSLARKHAGTGLGLSLVSRMAEMHGGGVSVESEVGQGSRFTVSLPHSGPSLLHNQIDIDSNSESEQAIVIGRNRTTDKQPVILLADDNEDNIGMILEFLEVQGYQINIARNGKEAIERAKEEKPDVILMDVQMPELDGLEATRRLKADVDFADVPIITLTALAMPGDRERCLAAGANEYLSKPVSPTGLIKTIEQFLK